MEMSLYQANITSVCQSLECHDWPEENPFVCDEDNCPEILAQGM